MIRRVPTFTKIVHRVKAEIPLESLYFEYEGVGTLTELDVIHPDGARVKQITISMELKTLPTEPIVERPNGSIT